MHVAWRLVRRPNVTTTSSVLRAPFHALTNASSSMMMRSAMMEGNDHVGGCSSRADSAVGRLCITMVKRWQTRHAAVKRRHDADPRDRETTFVTEPDVEEPIDGGNAASAVGFARPIDPSSRRVQVQRLRTVDPATGRVTFMSRTADTTDLISVGKAAVGAFLLHCMQKGVEQGELLSFSEARQLNEFVRTLVAVGRFEQRLEDRDEERMDAMSDDQLKQIVQDAMADASAAKGVG